MTRENHNKRAWRGIIAWVGLLAVVQAQAQTASLAPGRESDILNTKHNFAAGMDPTLPPGEARSVKATSENQTCVFCHTPHGKPQDATRFLWNRRLDVGPYTLYGSSSLDATPGQPGIPSKMCLSCHDGTLAVNTLNVFTDTTATPSVTRTDVSVAMTGLAADNTMPGGVGAATGYTRDLGADLSNDHPIGFTYDTTLANSDGELVDPATTDYLGPRVGAGMVQHNKVLGGSPPSTAPTATQTRLAAPLEPAQNSWAGTTNYAELLSAGAMECTTCHDPHLRSSDNTINIKFLRLNRIQKAQPSPGFSIDEDINCLACHQKPGWPHSAHAHVQVADEAYTADETSRRELPDGTRVWETACTACHDPHTVTGAPRLLREGTDDTGTPKSGGNAASEEACYQCHGDVASSVLSDLAAVANVQREFEKSSTMPIQVNQAGDPTQEVHQVIDADLTEPAANLGNGDGSERHVECADCHHPHRLIKKPRFNDDPTTVEVNDQATHLHEVNVVHSNVASGALRGIWGVEPEYANEDFNPATNTVSFQVKKGDPGEGATDDVNNPYLTREYQVCLKCHSGYANGQGKTDQALEFQAPPTHQGEPSATHQSWHPVIRSTGRDSIARAGADATLWLAPWDQGLGAQTMYCSDCHASDDPTAPAGPHGSNNGSSFGSGRGGLLIGAWSTDTGKGGADNQDLCFACHDYDQYANPATAVTAIKTSGFSCASCVTVLDTAYSDNLHLLHAVRNDSTFGVGTGARCMDCHVAMPHGWKNKGLLVDLNAVGSEFGRADAAVSPPYTEAPYYNAALLQVNSYQLSGQWTKASCGASGGCH